MIKTKYKITAPKKTWKSILLSLELYPGHCFTFDSETGGGIVARWAPTGEDRGVHQEVWRMKVSGRLEKRMPNHINIIFREHKIDDPFLQIRGSHVFEMEDSQEWIDKVLDEGKTIEFQFDYNDGSLARVAR